MYIYQYSFNKYKSLVMLMN